MGPGSQKGNARRCLSLNMAVKMHEATTLSLLWFILSHKSGHTSRLATRTEKGRRERESYSLHHTPPLDTAQSQLRDAATAAN